ncbi:MAG: hypothetical protein R3C53_13965 [Pirellulaceae bacterium]
MKKLLSVVTLLGCSLVLASPAMAIKQFNDQFKELYAGEKADKELVALITEAKCNVCHVQKENKKVRNPYGEALHEMIEKDEFPVKEFKADSKNEKLVERLNGLFKKVLDEKSGDEKHKTFAARMEAKLLPGGDTDGKGLGKKD